MEYVDDYINETEIKDYLVNFNIKSIGNFTIKETSMKAQDFINDAEVYNG